MKTTVFTIAAIAATAGIAAASPLVSPINSHQSDGSNQRGATAIRTIDLSGVESWDWYNDPDNFYAAYSFNPDTHIVGVGWDLTIQTEGASWMSEVNIDIMNSAGTGGVTMVPGFHGPYSGTETFSSGGIIDIVGNGDFLLNGDGLLRMTVYESWDDNDNAVDARFLAGSALYIQYVIPAPGALGLLGLAGLAGSRRRRG